GREPARLRFRLDGAEAADPDAPTQDGASALLRITASDPDRNKVGRAFSAACVELALSSVPGFHATAPPGDARPAGVAFTAAQVPADQVPHTAVLPDGTRLGIAPAPAAADPAPVPEPPLPPPPPDGPVRRAPLGLVAGARSGDKGSDANVGVWVRDDAAWRWLAHALTVDAFKRLIPEAAPLPVTRHLFPHLRAANFVVEGLLGDGAGGNTRSDPQAKALGEWLRGRHLDVPEALLP